MCILSRSVFESTLGATNYFMFLALIPEVDYTPTCQMYFTKQCT